MARGERIGVPEVARIMGGSEYAREERLERARARGRREAELHFLDKRGMAFVGEPEFAPGIDGAVTSSTAWRDFIAAGLPDRRPDQVYVYIVGYGPYVKVGMCKADLGVRMSNLQNGAPEPLQIYKVLVGDVALERSLHQEFASLRLQGEWFRLKDELAAWIEAGCPI